MHAAGTSRKFPGPSARSHAAPLTLWQRGRLVFGEENSYHEFLIRESELTEGTIQKRPGRYRVANAVETTGVNAVVRGASTEPGSRGVGVAGAPETTAPGVRPGHTAHSPGHWALPGRCLFDGRGQQPGWAGPPGSWRTEGGPRGSAWPCRPEGSSGPGAWVEANLHHVLKVATAHTGVQVQED